MIAAWFSWIDSMMLLTKFLSWSAPMCSGPLLSQSWICLRLSATCCCRSGRPLLNVMITKVSRPPTIAMPTIITIRADTPRGTPHVTSRSTPGAISAASSKAIATGTTICEK